jgi:hypothetical protein
MFDITARILTINIISDKSAQIILKKTIKGKQTPIAINVFGIWKIKMDKMKLLKNEKISGKVYVNSNMYKGKWYTDIYFNEINRFVEKPKYDPYSHQQIQKPIENDLFKEEDLNGGIGNKYIIDEETGEVLL